MTTPRDTLDEIRKMAGVDHVHGLSAAYNPYLVGSAEAAAWLEGWQAEEDAERKLDEEGAKLPFYRVRALIVADGEAAPLAEIPRDEWAGYGATHRKDLPDGALFQSKEANARFPGHTGVAILVEYPEDRTGLEDFKPA